MCPACKDDLKFPSDTCLGESSLLSINPSPLCVKVSHCILSNFCRRWRWAVLGGGRCCDEVECDGGGGGNGGGGGAYQKTSLIDKIF